jgi:hypothetical protein
MIRARSATNPGILIGAGWQIRRRHVHCSTLGGVEQPDWRAVQVCASHRISAFDMTQRDVARMAQESTNALSARSVLFPAAPVIMIHVHELPLLKRLVAHAAGVLLSVQ